MSFTSEILELITILVVGAAIAAQHMKYSQRQ